MGKKFTETLAVDEAKGAVNGTPAKLDENYITWERSALLPAFPKIRLELNRFTGALSILGGHGYLPDVYDCGVIRGETPKLMCEAGVIGQKKVKWVAIDAQRATSNGMPATVGANEISWLEDSATPGQPKVRYVFYPHLGDLFADSGGVRPDLFACAQVGKRAF